MQHKNSHEPLIRLSKRTDISLFKAILVRAVAIVAALILCAVIVMLITGGKTGFFQVYTEMFRGTFGSTRRITMLLRDISALLCIGVGAGFSDAVLEHWRRRADDHRCTGICGCY